MANSVQNNSPAAPSMREAGVCGELRRQGVVLLEGFFGPKTAQSVKATLERVLQDVGEIDALRAAWEAIQRDGGFQLRSLAGDAALLSRLTDVVRAVLVPDKEVLLDLLKRYRD
jgi:hypothetical protein